MALLTDTDARASNAMGVFMSPALRQHTLRAARDAIDAALSVMTGTVWPLAADYDNPDHANDF